MQFCLDCLTRTTSIIASSPFRNLNLCSKDSGPRSALLILLLVFNRNTACLYADHMGKNKKIHFLLPLSETNPVAHAKKFTPQKMLLLVKASAMPNPKKREQGRGGGGGGCGIWPPVNVDPALIS
uniref:Uncharacterized protein n=1 Tax=Physcomitrium patens TaxID=3218 RepID=A0A2K1IP22_PHYPA|nr:hypothetical protein PHYPA_027345 [Physcomitrium patens]